MHRKRTTTENTPAWAERRREEERRKSTTNEGKKTVVARRYRYRAGVAPEWTKEEEEEEDDDDDDDSDDEKNGLELDAKKKKKKSYEESSRRSSSSEATPPTTDEEESSGEEESRSSDSEDARDRTREMVKAKRLNAKGVRIEEEKKTKEENDDEEDESDDDDDDASTTSSTSFSTSSSEDSATNTDGGGGPPKMFKPVFVSKAKRDANAKAEAAARDMMDGGDDDQKNEEEEKMMIKKQNAREAVQREITLEYQREVAEKDYAGEEVNTDSDDDDEEEARKNYEQWKMREFKRVVRDRCKQRLEMEEEEERERLRNMTEEERELYATKLKALKDAKEHGKEKSKMRFMQKYYHKGAFFQDAGDDEFATTEKAEIFNRDFNEATNAEKGVDRTTVPEAMRLRQGQFGKAGRSKWTHLSNEDTTFVNTEDARLRNAQQALMKQKKLEEQQPGADGGVEENKSGGNFRAGVVLGSRLAADKNVEKILDAKRAGMKSSKTTN